jgi:surface protein
MDDVKMDLESSDFPKLGGLPKWKKYLIIGSVISVFFIIFLIIIILIATSGKSGDDNKSDEEEVKKTKIGQFMCTYDISNKQMALKILGDNFKNEGNIGIKIGDKEIKFSKEYKFDEKDDGKIEFEIYSPINMDYMFKDVSALISITMLSNNDAKVTSMISTFENCENLNDFSMSGFNTKEVKSMKNLFYKSNIPIINIVGLNTESVEDFSYMFASVNSDRIELVNFNTKNAKNMSHMFDYSNVGEIDFSNIDTSNVEDMSYMFKSCVSINSLDLSKFNTKKLKIWQGSFMIVIS